MQHVLEHGSPQQRHEVVEVIHSDIQRLARHRVASHVVRCALKHSSPEDRQKLVQAIRWGLKHVYMIYNTELYNVCCTYICFTFTFIYTKYRSV